MKWFLKELKRNPQYMIRCIIKYFIKGYWYKSEAQVVEEVLGHYGTIKYLAYLLNKKGETNYIFNTGVPELTSPYKN